jgi:SAM-dependent MidA family methyltransferase
MVGRMQPDTTDFLPWSLAMERALYGPEGFYRAGLGPAAHFRTSVHASPLFATAVLRLLREADEALGEPEQIALVDVGAGRGELLQAVRAQLAEDPLSRRLHLVAVEVAARPDDLTSDIEWRSDLPAEVTGLIIANEWLDNVPCDVAEATREGWRIVEVAADGAERLGAQPSSDQQAWLSAWWPISETSPIATHDASSDQPLRAEIGASRDTAWQRAVAALEKGIAVAVDYAHDRASRPPSGTLTGYAHGRQTAPIPDGSCDITAHVALDSCAAAASRADWTLLSTQRAVFHSLGMTGGRPDLALASSDPRGYLRALSQASAAAELTDPHGLGGFGWLVQGVAVPMPAALARL